MSTYTQLATTTVGAGGASSVTFSNYSMGYTDLVVVVSNRDSYSTFAELFIRFNNSSSSIYGYRFLRGDGSAAGTASGTSVTSINGGVQPGTSQTANTFASTSIYIPNYASNSTYKSISADNVSENNATAAYSQLSAGLYSDTSPITEINLIAGFVQYSTVTLYGVYKGAEVASISAPTIGTATAGDASATVAFTPPATTSNIASYVATSSPGSITGYGTSSPISVSGLTNGTAYTFTVAGLNPNGTGSQSAASNSVTPQIMSYESISTYTLSSTTSTVTFSSIPSTYKHLQIRIYGKSEGTTYPTDNLGFKFNGEANTSLQSSHYLVGDGGSISSGGRTNSGELADVIGRNGTWGSCVIDILDYSNTNKYKTVKAIGGADANGSGRISLTSLNWRSTSAITSILLDPNGNSWSSGSKIALYGIKG